MLCVWFLIVSLYSSSAVVHHLNDSEYQRMPPVFSLDEYEPCLVEEGSTYCMLQLHLYAEPENELMHMITEYSEVRLKHFNHSIIDRGVCVKKSCQKYIKSNTTDLTSSLEACLNDSLRREYGVNAKVSILYYCDHHNEPRHIDDWDWTVLIVILGLVIMNIIGSAHDYFLSKRRERTLENENALLRSFSIMRNWKRLTNTETGDPKIRDLQFFHGVRVISNLCTIIMHTLVTFITGFARNAHDVEKAFEDPFCHLMFNAMHIVQLFFFTSGFLTSYLMKIEEQKRRFTLWDVLKIMVLRLSRLVPVLAIVLALSMTWVRHVSSGPLWKLFVTGSLVEQCRTNGWRHLLFVNNYSDESKFCLITTWQLAAEVQVFLVVVTAYVMTRGRTRRIVLGALLLLSAVAPAIHTVLNDLDVVIIAPELTRTLSGNAFWLQHILGHCNLPCFIIGMATASLLHDWQKKGGQLVNNRWNSLVQYLSAAAIPLILYSGRIFYEDPQAPVLARAAHVSAVRLLLGLTSALAIHTFFSKTPTYLKSMLEWRRWVVPSRLTYCVFVLHMILVHMIMGARTQLAYFSFFNVMTVFLSIVVVSYIISVPLYLIVEAPFNAFFKNIVTKQTKQRSYDTNGNSCAKTSTVNGTSAVNGNSAGNRTSVAINGTSTLISTVAGKETQVNYGNSGNNGTLDITGIVAAEKSNVNKDRKEKTL